MLCAACVPELSASPLTFPAAAPISAGDITYRQQPGFTAGTLGHQQYDFESVMVYGLSHNIAFILEDNLPQYIRQTYFAPTLHTDVGFGPGDLSFLPRYTFWEQDGIGSTNRLSALGGLILPIGVHSQTNSYGRIPASLEPGRGAWGTKDGVIFTRQTLNAEIDGYGGFVHSGVSHGYQFGNEYFADSSLQRRISPKHLNQGVPRVETFLVCESNLFFNKEDSVASTVNFSDAKPSSAALPDLTDLPSAPEPQTSTLSNSMMSPMVSPDDLVTMTPNVSSGGTLFQLDPGIRFVGLNWGFAALAEVPAYVNANGGGYHKNYGILLVYRHVFFTRHHL